MHLFCNNENDRYMWPTSSGPSYSKAFLGCISVSLVTLGMLWVFRLHLVRLNEKAKMNELILGLPTGFRYIT